MAPGCELGVWVDLRQRGLPMGLGNRLAANSGQRGLPTFPQSARPTMEMMENRLLVLWVALRIKGYRVRSGFAAHADMCPLQGAGGVWLGRVGIIWSRVAKGRLRILRLLVVRGGIGYGWHGVRFSQGSNRP